MALPQIFATVFCIYICNFIVNGGMLRAMAKNRSPDSARSIPPEVSAGSPISVRIGESPVADPESVGDLQLILGRAPSDEEAAGWGNMSAALRRRAAARIALLRRWTEDRGELTAIEAAGIAGVEPNRFYQMASAWRRAPGLLAVGAYAAGGPDRSSKVDPAVNAALQAEVVDVVGKGQGQGASVEAMRRRLEAVVRRRVPLIGEDGGPRMPSPKTVRAVITREQARVAEMGMLGESVVLDCCPTSMRAADGTPFDLFGVIDRGTLRILGHALGSIGDSVDGHRRAAQDALEQIGGMSSPQPWAITTRRADVVVGTDIDAWPDIITQLKDTVRPADALAITRDRRFGSQFRKYIGERIAGVWLRPTWVLKPPPTILDGTETFTPDEARRRAATEISVWNTTKIIERDGGAPTPPDGLIEALRLLAG